MRIAPLALLLALTACDSGASGAAASGTTAAAAPAPAADSQQATPALAAAASAEIAVGAVAPDFELPGSDGQTHRLSDYRGQHVVLAFFPKAFTGG